MNITCDVIRDLLPLYHDDICSADSRTLIETHLDTCEDCKKELEKYNSEIVGGLNMNQTVHLDDAKQIENISRAWKRDKKVSFLKGVTFISILGSLAATLAYNAHGSYVAPDGRLVEAFGFIPLAFLFAFIAIISGLSLAVLMLIRKFKG
ncbi:zf-HC2 domain-containing protein [Fusibacter sp. JL216-2]|uniref:zf-HC2 domain-containing protein n=1 Tax=Fusibacter sp. JL216-2 TaxID=3071453 RepID=UPI003D3594E2